MSLSEHQPTYNQPRPSLPPQIVFAGLLDSMRQRTFHKSPIFSGMSDLRPKTQPRAGLDADVLNRQYVMHKAATIRTFVSEHRLRSTLLEARKHLDAEFGQDSIKKLEIIRDDEGSETLFCSVVVRDNLRQAKVALRRFDDRWWLERIGKVAGKLNFDIELV